MNYQELEAYITEEPADASSPPISSPFLMDCDEMEDDLDLISGLSPLAEMSLEPLLSEELLTSLAPSPVEVAGHYSFGDSDFHSLGKRGADSLLPSRVSLNWSCLHCPLLGSVPNQLVLPLRNARLPLLRDMLGRPTWIPSDTGLGR